MQISQMYDFALKLSKIAILFSSLRDPIPFSCVADDWSLMAPFLVIVVALNYQTEGRMMQIYQGKFKSNGNCGYVLKPEVMCEGILGI